MKVFAIGDLHLPGGDVKPMDIFGKHWEGHYEKIRADWLNRVCEEDVVLIPGDISWAMTLEEATPDLLSIGELPGQIVLLRGNHDYWWSSVTRLRAILPGNMHALQNDALVLGDLVLAGSRGWTLPGQNTTVQDEKIYARETARLELSLKEAVRLGEGRPILAMMHYPPVTPDTLQQGTEFTRMLERYPVVRCVYGHLHGPSIRWGYNGTYHGIRYDLTSCDALDFRLKQIDMDLYL